MGEQEFLIERNWQNLEPGRGRKAAVISSVLRLK